MIKLTGNILLWAGLIYFFVFGLESDSQKAILHTIIGTALMFVGACLLIYDYFKKSRK
jgi:hypothetical protein